MNRWKLANENAVLTLVFMAVVLIYVGTDRLLGTTAAVVALVLLACGGVAGFLLWWRRNRA